ncbi:TPA: hypothetical protein KKK89_004329 [Escherichia coli]|nr:hypothetical protein [Escherichia coli]
MGSCAAPSAKGDDKFITTDYLQQCQSRQHTGMKQIGVLHTDPPKWLDNDHPPFEKHMYGVFMHLRY